MSISIFSAADKFRDEFDKQIDPKEEHRYFIYSGEQMDVYASVEPREGSYSTPHEEGQKWRFSVGCRDDSCGVYHAIETIRTAIFEAMEASSHSVDIYMVTSGSNDDTYHFHKAGPQDERVNLSQIRDRRLPHRTYGCRTGFEKTLFERIVRAALTSLLTESGCEISERMVANCQVQERSIMGDVRPATKDLAALHISWSPETVPNYPLPLPPQAQAAPKIDSRMAKAYQNGSRTDFEIATKEAPLKAHKLILATASRYLETMIDSKYKEAANSRLELLDTPHNVVKACLDYIYLGTNPYEGEGKKAEELPDPMALFKLSHLWELEELNAWTAGIIGRNADLQNYAAIGQLGKTYRSKYLLEVYNCLRLRAKQAIPQNMLQVMGELGIHVGLGKRGR